MLKATEQDLDVWFSLKLMELGAQTYMQISNALSPFIINVPNRVTKYLYNRSCYMQNGRGAYW